LTAASSPAEGGDTVVFLGPSLGLEAAKTILPAARYCPPVAQGDVYSLLGAGPPDAIGIVDGVFYQDLPVWHKEILAALEAGVAVYGASSMGALRAVECAPFGMVGVGAIFDAYASGELVDDDEVAVAHDGADQGWRPRTEPLVNLRASLRQAVAAGTVGGDSAAQALEVARGIWFADRTRPALLQAWSQAGSTPEQLGALRSALEIGYVDQKGLDALALLRRLRDRRRGDDRAEPVLARSHVFLAFAERDRKVVHKDGSVRLEEIARHAALHEPEFPELRERAVDRLLVDELAWLWEIEVTDEEVARELHRLRVRLGLSDDESLETWLGANDVGPQWLQEMARREALAHRLRDWAQVRRGKQLLVEPILDELRLTARYPRVAAAAAAASALRASLDPNLGWSDETGDDDGTGRAEARVVELVRDHVRGGSWRPEVTLVRFAEEAGFADLQDLLDDLVAARAVRQRARERLQLLERLFGGDGNG
jgi:hypothetical protein